MSFIYEDFFNNSTKCLKEEREPAYGPDYDSTKPDL